MNRENLETTKAALRRVADQLLTLANEGSTHDGLTHASTVINGPTNAVTTPVTTPVTPRNTIYTEHGKTFNYQPKQTRPPNFHPANQPSLKNIQAKRKSKKKTVKSCTLKFFCLGYIDDDRPPPTVAGKAALSNCGLGPGTIMFDNNSSGIHEGLIERFPLLSSAGGYELLLYQRGGTEQGFHKIPMPHTPPRIKELAGQAHIYIRPLQESIARLHVEGPNVAYDQCAQPEGSGPLIECLQCHKNVPMDDFRIHQEEEHGQRKKRRIVNTLDEYVLSDSDTESTTNTEPTNISIKPSEIYIEDDESTMPGPSTALTEKLDQLIEMFPQHEIETLRNCLTIHPTVAGAALSLSTSLIDDDHSGYSDNDILPSTPLSVSLPSLLQQLQENFSDEKEKLKVDEEDLLNDALTYYKDLNFDPKKKLRVIYNGQPAADTGGVIRQFYTQLLQSISELCFHGDECKSPVYNCEIIASGMMKYVGTIIVHSILQSGPGFPVFSPALYHYLATGNIDESVQKMSINDCSLRMKQFINKVVQTVDMSTIDQEEVTSILSDCGLTVNLTNATKMRVIQGIVIHDVIGRPKIVLDQLRDGLQTLGFGAMMKKYPDIFKQLFVHNEIELSGDGIIDILEFPAAMNENETNTHVYLKEFLQDASQETLKQFLIFASGSPCLPNFGLGRISVGFENVASIFASTCSQRLSFPACFPDKCTFSESLQAVIELTGKAFNCI